MINEEALQQSVEDGTWLGSTIFPTWNVGDPVPQDLTVSAETLRKVMLTIDPSRSPYGLMLRGVIIVGNLELSDLTIGYRIRWRRCLFTGQVDFENARLRRLALGGCRFEQTLYADRLTVDGAVHFSDDSQGPGIVPFRAMGGIRLGGAKLGSLTLSGADLGPDQSGRSLYAQGLRVDGSAKLGSSSGGSSLNAEGTIILAGATIGDSLELSDSRINTAANSNAIANPAIMAAALEAQRINVGGNLDGAGLATKGPVDLQGATIGGQLTLSKRVGGSLNLRDATIATLNLTDPQHPRLKSAMGFSVKNVTGWAGDDAKAAKSWLKDASEEAAQPHLEFADFYESDGKPAKAKLLRVRAAHLATAKTPPLRRPARWISFITIGYGYYPLITIAWLAVLLGVTFGLVCANAPDFTAASTVVNKVASTSDSTGLAGRVSNADCVTALSAATRNAPSPWTVPCLSPLNYTLTNSLPAVPGAVINPWTPPGWLEPGLIGLRLLGWLFTVLLLAGLTGLLRKI